PGGPACHVDQRHVAARNAEALAERRMLRLVGEEIGLAGGRKAGELGQRPQIFRIEAAVLQTPAVIGATRAEARELAPQLPDLKRFELGARHRRQPLQPWRLVEWILA